MRIIFFFLYLKVLIATDSNNAEYLEASLNLLLSDCLPESAGRRERTARV